MNLVGYDGGGGGGQKGDPKNPNKKKKGVATLAKSRNISRTLEEASMSIGWSLGLVAVVYIPSKTVLRAR